ncbi:hypothetical protein NPIL_220851 [Nephila pilipes]|uniref:Uncharacterized protein n=1 Tax=Nephila pilipes TaxID=299642 RepID=A0A8X6TJ63_NEPPI|nr:hypothetical protein NPIL_220851 [Nephila pilipes]
MFREESRLILALNFFFSTPLSFSSNTSLEFKIFSFSKVIKKKWGKEYKEETEFFLHVHRVKRSLCFLRVRLSVHRDMIFKRFIGLQTNKGDAASVAKPIRDQEGRERGSLQLQISEWYAFRWKEKVAGRSSPVNN